MLAKAEISYANVFARPAAERRQLISQLQCPRGRYIVPMNTIHHRLHCVMHTDARTDYTFRIRAAPEQPRAATPRISRSIQAKGGLNLSHFILQDYARVKLRGEGILTVPGLAPLRKNSEITRFNSS